VESRSHCAGEKICRRGDTGYGLFLIRRGAVRIGLPVAPGQHHHLATSGRGSSFGEVSFFDRDVRSADAIAHSDTDLYILPRERFDALAQDHRRLAFQLLYGLGSARSSGLRFANAELRALEHG
jgi:SulP family sulfate permease